MKKQEAKFTTRVRKWLRDHGTGAYEIKHTRGSEHFNCRELKRHQRDCLLAAASPIGFAYKIPDDGVAYKPFDVVAFKGARAYVVICYPEEFSVIPIAKMEGWRAPTLSVRNARIIAEVTLRLEDL